MMYEVNKYSLTIKERPDVKPYSPYYVIVGEHKRPNDTSLNYYADTLKEAQAKLIELKADAITHYERAIAYHEDQALYNRGRLAAILKEHHPDTGKVMDEKKPG